MRAVLTLLTLFFLLLPSVMAGEYGAPEGCLYRVFEWSYGGDLLSFEVAVPLADYMSYAVVSDSVRGNLSFGSMVSWRDEVVGEVALKLGGVADEAGYGEGEKVDLVFAFVKSLWRAGQNSRVRFPVETLAEGWGSAPDLAILYTALTKHMGYDVLLLIDGGGGLYAGISTSGVSGSYITWNGKKYYIADFYGGEKSATHHSISHQRSLRSKGFRRSRLILQAWKSSSKKLRATWG